MIPGAGQVDDENVVKLTTEGGDACPVCRASTRPTAELDDYQLFGCPACQSWSSSALARGAVTSFEPEAYFRNPDADRGKWQALHQKLRKNGVGARRALDVGCGTGAFLAFGRETMEMVECTGIELDAARSEEARARNPGADIRTGDALEMAAQLEGPFDLITLWDVFEHVPDPRTLMATLAGLLAPGGALYVQTIHEQSILPALGRLAYDVSGGRLRYPVRRTHDAHHLVFFSLGGLDLLADFAGLDIDERWFDRLARSRMDGSPAVTAFASLLLAAENALGNGLFVNLLLRSR